MFVPVFKIENFALPFLGRKLSINLVALYAIFCLICLIFTATEFSILLYSAISKIFTATDLSTLSFSAMFSASNWGSGLSNPRFKHLWWPHIVVSLRTAFGQKLCSPRPRRTWTPWSCWYGQLSRLRLAMWGHQMSRSWHLVRSHWGLEPHLNTKGKFC